MRKPANNWLDRRIAAPGPCLTLCLAESEFVAAMRHCGVEERPPWVSRGASATTHMLERAGERVAIVCVGPLDGRTPIEVAGLLVHEAVHVWQEYCDSIGEREPASEQEAYGIQCVAQELMAEFARRMGSPA